MTDKDNWRCDAFHLEDQCERPRDHEPPHLVRPESLNGDAIAWTFFENVPVINSQQSMRFNIDANGWAVPEYTTAVTRDELVDLGVQALRRDMSEFMSTPYSEYGVIAQIIVDELGAARHLHHIEGSNTDA